MSNIVPQRRNHLYLTAFLCFQLCSGSVIAADTTAISITGTLVDAPDCTVNGNNVVDINFGSKVITRQIDGQNFKQPIALSLVCNPLTSNNLIISISGTDAGFGSGYIKTDRTGLGIRLFNGSTPVNNNAPISFTFPQLPDLYAAPVALAPETLTAGPFTGTASLVLNYQ